MDASDLLRNTLLQLSKSSAVRQTIESAPLAKAELPTAELRGPLATLAVPIAMPLAPLTVLLKPKAAPNWPPAPTVLLSPTADAPVAAASIWLPVPTAVLKPAAAMLLRLAVPPLPMAVDDRPVA